CGRAATRSVRRAARPWRSRDHNRVGIVMKRLLGTAKSHLTALIVIAVVGVTGVVGAAVAVNAATTGSAPGTHFAGVDEIVEACTNSKTFVNMPQMSQMFIIGGGTATDEVAAMFQGAVSLGADGGAFDTGFVRLTIDGVAQPPGTIPLVGVNNNGT